MNLHFSFVVQYAYIFVSLLLSKFNSTDSLILVDLPLASINNFDLNETCNKNI